MRDFAFGQFHNGNGRCGNALQCAGVQNDGPVATHPKGRLMRVATTEQVPLAGRRFAVEAALIMPVHRGDLLVGQRDVAEIAVTGDMAGFECLVKFRFAPIAVSQDEINRRSGELRQDRRRADVAAMDDPFHPELAEHEHRLVSKQDIAVRVADNAEVHGDGLKKKAGMKR